MKDINIITVDISPKDINISATDISLRKIEVKIHGIIHKILRSLRQENRKRQ